MVTSDAVQKARQKARAAFEAAHYDGSCTVTEHRKVMNERSHLTTHEDVVVYEDQACHLSYKTIQSANQSDTAAPITQITKLFIAPDITIKPGSKITVVQSGITGEYTHSGIPAVYDTHQEIILEPFERWS